MQGSIDVYTARSDLESIRNGISTEVVKNLNKGNKNNHIDKREKYKINNDITIKNANQLKKEKEVISPV